MDKQTRPVRPGGMGRMRGSAEKAKDFKTAMKKLRIQTKIKVL